MSAVCNECGAIVCGHYAEAVQALVEVGGDLSSARSQVGGLVKLVQDADEQVARLKRALVWKAAGYATHNAPGNGTTCICKECANARSCLEEALR